MSAPAKLNVTLGQEVVVLPHTGGYPSRPQFGLRVTRVSPSGKFEIAAGDRTRFFNAQGYEVADNLNGKVKGYGATVSTDVRGWTDRSEQDTRQKAAAGALNDVKLGEQVRSTYSKEYMLAQVAKLEELLRTAREAVSAI